MKSRKGITFSIGICLLFVFLTILFLSFRKDSRPVMVAFGDSIMYGAGNDGTGIADLLNESNKYRLYDYSLGGSTVSYTEKKDADNFIKHIYHKYVVHKDYSKLINITYQVDSAIEKVSCADIILIDGGINDVFKNAEIGELSMDKSTFDKSTFSGGLEYCLSELKSHYTNAVIIYINTHMDGATNSNSQILFSNKAKEICSLYGVKYIDITKESGFDTSKNEYIKYTANEDKIHPTDEGYKKFYIPEIKEKINQLTNNK